MARIFIYDNREFPDPDPKLTVDQVRQNMAAFFPELANAEVKGPTKRPNPKEPGVTDDVYTFVKRVGTKGKQETAQKDLKSGIYGVNGFKRVAKRDATFTIDPYDYDKPLHFTATNVKKLSEIYEHGSVDGPIVLKTGGYETIIIALDND